MATAAEQYRSLVNKLERLLAEEGETPLGNGYKGPELRIGDIDPSNGRIIKNAAVDSNGIVIRSSDGSIYNVEYGPPVKPGPGPKPNEITPNLQDPEKVDAPLPNINVAPEEQPPAPTPEPTPPAPTPPAPTPEPTTTCPPEVLAQIKAAKTFNQAYALAKKSNCPDFEWCQIVDVGQGPKPAPQPTDKPVQSFPQFDPRIGPTLAYVTDLPGTSHGIMPENYEIKGSDEIDRIREIAGNQILEAQPGGIPEIKAASKEKAIAIARQKGITRFRFCGKYKVQQAKKGQDRRPPTPKPADKPVQSFPQ
ncbi:MAG: hypothetical protein EBT86_12010, partial [Actinobacteria bacterium]|nr:hypothetical protein [Actinomycetota bacterium]